MLPAKRRYFDPTGSAAIYLINSNDRGVFRQDLRLGKSALVPSSENEVVDFAKFGVSVFAYKYMGMTSVFNNWIWRWNVY